ncbi:hypothetical protein PCYB_082760 [Plasmodium cynomolgi strain B]|uniref:Uncharacterized protein n=1 Tax=Plasmodium cynomolgi (strain B) TaxID=1120755 RepID=K6UV40_PLACD|nr:hypothetical protein PCYB_082760 [Plasmodium cynomolgi strain B]GAB66115.1 hypothetical protein PCYB_082760 [Plasmodium cynomolgi strain B]
MGLGSTTIAKLKKGISERRADNFLIDELDAIKDYLTELNRSAQSLQNANYHRSVLKATSRKDPNEKKEKQEKEKKAKEKENPFLRCIQMRRDVEKQFKCIDLVSHSKDMESTSTSNDPSEGERQNRREEAKAEQKKEQKQREQKKEQKKEQKQMGQTKKAEQMGQTKKAEQMGQTKRTEQTEQTELTNQTANFTNERERELFQYLIVKANNEIENINLSLGKKYEEELKSKMDKVKSSYENKIKNFSKEQKFLCDEKEQMVKEDKYNKEVIKKLEKKNLLLVHQVEQLKKKLHLVCDEALQKEVPKWNTEQAGMGTLRDGLYREGHQLIRDYEKKINKLNEQLNRTHGECLSFKTKWGVNSSYTSERRKWYEHPSAQAQ